MALGAEEASELPWYMGIVKSLIGGFPEINGWLVASFALVMGLMRVLSEFLLFIHDKTATQFDDNLLARLTKILKYAAQISAWFGVGKPKKLDE